MNSADHETLQSSSTDNCRYDSRQFFPHSTIAVRAPNRSRELIGVDFTTYGAISTPICVFDSRFSLVYHNRHFRERICPKRRRPDNSTSLLDSLLLPQTRIHTFYEFLVESAQRHSTRGDSETTSTSMGLDTPVYKYVGQLPFKNSAPVCACVSPYPMDVAGVSHYWVVMLDTIDERLLFDRLDLLASRFKLSDTEKAIAKFLLQGHSNKEMARKRNVSTETVKKQVQTVLGKLSLNRRNELLGMLLHSDRA